MAALFGQQAGCSGHFVLSGGRRVQSGREQCEDRVLSVESRGRYGQEHKDYVAYFPEYHAKAKEAECLYSDPVGVSPLVLVERKAEPVTWHSYDDLAGRKIGVVKGYLNTEELDARIASKVLAVDHALDDARNILKLAAGRVDAAVIDLNVFNYLVKNDASVKAAAGPLQVNAKFLEDKQLFICFTRSPEGEKARQVFNLGLRKRMKRS